MRKSFAISLTVAAVLFLSAATAMSQSDGSRPDAIRVMGSVVVTRVIEPWAKEFQKIEPNISVVLYGSSDAAGFQSVLAKDADVAMSITEPSNEDREEAARKGIHFVEHPVGYVTGAIIVHRLILVEALTMDQLRSIFGGQCVNWSRVGGPDESVVVVAMEMDAGAKFLAEQIFKTSFTPTAQMVKNYRKMVDMVSRRKGAIGFAPSDMAYQAGRDNRLRIVGLRKDENTPSAMPPHDLSPEDAIKSSYPLIKPLLLYCDASARSHVRKFVEFCVDRGREMTHR
jgi:phosphate transport system substrate-binding protein